jgi:hypothetical protein
MFVETFIQHMCILNMDDLSPFMRHKIDVMKRQIRSLRMLKNRPSKAERYNALAKYFRPIDHPLPPDCPYRHELWDKIPNSCWTKRYFSKLIQRRLGLATTSLTRKAVRCVVDYLFGDTSIDAGDGRGVTSVGCGRGLLEVMLTQHVDEVVAIDIFLDDLTEAARLALSYPDAQGSDYIECECPVKPIPKHHTLFFAFPYMDDCVFDCYVKLYRGDRIVILGDSSCKPMPETTIHGFKQTVCDIYPYSHLRPVITVFERTLR